MAVEFPELTSFGTLFRFALALEDVAADLAARVADHPRCSLFREAAMACSARHRKRGQDLDRLRRERLNEVALQAISGLDRSAYLPDQDLIVQDMPADPDGAAIALRLAAVEETAARFYDDGGRIAAEVLIGVEKAFNKLALENRDLAATLREQAR